MSIPSEVPLETVGRPAPAKYAIPWVPIAWLGALLFLCYLPILQRLVSQWMNDEDMGHGFFVPLVSLFITWQMREDLAKIPLKPNWWGLALVAWGGIQAILGTVGAELFISRTAFLVSLVGILLCICGTKFVKALAFPLFLLVFMVPIPAIIYNQITFPLQLLATRMAEVFLSLFGYPVLREGNVLHLASQSLNVVEACSGIRSLLSLTFISLVYAHFFDNKPWMKIALLLCVIPIALFANAMRVTLTGIVSEIDPTLAEGIFHSLEGLVLFALDLVALVAIHKLINKIYARTQHANAPVTVAS